MKNIRNIVIAFIMGLLVSLPVNAAIQEYSLKQSEWVVMVDGQVITDDKYPVLLMDPGYNYLAAGTLREVCSKAGIPFDVNAELKQVRLTTKQTVAVKSAPVPTIAPTLSKVKYYEPMTIERVGVKYAFIGDIIIMLESRGYELIDNAKLNMTLRICTNDKLILDDIPVNSFSSKAYISYDFFIEHIKPLITN